MYIYPNTDIRILSGVPLNNDYDNTWELLRFCNKLDQMRLSQSISSGFTLLARQK